MSSRRARSRTRAGRPWARLTAPIVACLLLSSPLAAQAGADAERARGHRGEPPSTASTEPRTAETALPSTVGAWAARLQIFASLLAFDEGMQVAVRDGDAPTGEPADVVARWAERLGDWHLSLPLMAAGCLGIAGLTEGSRGLGKGLAMLGGIVGGSMANEGLNQAVGRSRPLEGEGAFAFRPFTGHASFPSGHTALAFSFAGAVDVATDGWLPAAAAYGAAGLTGLSRMYHDKHWLSDVVVGAIVGTVVSRRVTRTLAGWMGVGGEASERGPAVGGRASGAGTGGGPGPRGVAAELLVTPRAVGLRLRF